MPSKFIQGTFTPTNPQKYMGTYPITARSSWEFAVMRMADKHPNVKYWASESVQIPYMHPFQHKKRMYIPDFLFVYEDKHGRTHTEIIEVKPLSQSVVSEARSRHDKAALAVNAAKWSAATRWCKNNGLRFRVITEREIFRS